MFTPEAAASAHVPAQSGHAVQGVTTPMCRAMGLQVGRRVVEGRPMAVLTC